MSLPNVHYDPAFSDRVARAEEILGYKFKDPGILEVAITHPSAGEPQERVSNYERLEFLGDSILGAIIAEEVFMRYPDLDEGGLTHIKVALVSGSTLSDVAKEAGIADCIIFGESELNTSARGLHSALENVFEALVAALFLDGGIEPARTWSLKMLGPLISRDLAVKEENPKSVLQEITQARRMTSEYEIVDEIGPSHDRTFVAVVRVNGKVRGQGKGRTKKGAEAAAAAEALKTFRK